MKLYDWTKHFINFMNANKKNILEIIDENENIIKVIEKNKINNTKYFVYYLINENLENSIKIIKNNEIKLSSNDKIYFVCNNQINNLNCLYDEWEYLSSNKNLVVIFCDLNKNNKWIIKPHIHNLIADKESLKEGLMSMYNSLSE